MSLEKDEVKKEEEEEDNECTCVSSPSFVYLLAMSRTVVFFILMIGLTHAQLNFEGNPLTENTEYTAEESHYSQSTAKREESTPSPANVLTDHPQKLYMFSEKDGRSTSQKPKLERNEMKSSLENAEQRNVVTVRQLSGSTYSQGTGMQQQDVQQMPYVPRIQARNDMYYPVGWQNPVRRIRGKPYPLVQPRIGPGSFVPNPVPFKKKGPVELIYTRPPGFLHRPPRMEKHPPPYLEDSIGYAEGDHPPSHNEIRYSQLYAQSYDPYYYDYIAKTGKIKPHLYWKLGKHRESKDDSIWTELYRGFKKHGLQKMMTPGFFLGMTLPVVTLMLTALIQKRSLSRSDSREFSQEDTMQEYLERLQRAMECYEKKRTKGEANEDEC